MKPTLGADELGYYVYPFMFDPACFGNKTKDEFIQNLRNAGIPTDDCYPPLHTLTCFKEVKLRKGIDYSNANWGGEKSDDKHFPVVTDVYARSIQLPQYLLLAEEESQLDYIAEIIQNMQ
jgi:dTDP-4-amino-4,6-dideoxygalactose transaminase